MKLCDYSMRAALLSCGVCLVAATAMAGSEKAGTCACACAVKAAKAASAEPELEATWESLNTCVYTKGEYTLKIEYLLKGTRSEGQNGILLKKKGKVVAGKEKGDVLDTSLGKLKYYGAERKVRWGITGWNFADRSNVKPSAKVPVKPKQEEDQ